MRVILIGPPGAGKGPQAAILSGSLGVPHISTGDLFREYVTGRTPLGREAKQYLDVGELVPDHVTNGMVRQRLSQPDAWQGFLLDGFPRTVQQAEELQAMLSESNGTLDAVLEFTVPEYVVVQRLLGRGRRDDTEEVIRHRQQVYRTQTAPILGYCADRLLTIPAIGVGPGRALPFGRGWDAVLAEDLPYGGGGDLDAECRELAVDSAVAPRGILARQTQHQGANRTDGGRAPATLRCAGRGVGSLELGLLHQDLAGRPHPAGPVGAGGEGSGCCPCRPISCSNRFVARGVNAAS